MGLSHTMLMKFWSFHHADITEGHRDVSHTSPENKTKDKKLYLFRPKYLVKKTPSLNNVKTTALCLL